LFGFDVFASVFLAAFVFWR